MNDINEIQKRFVDYLLVSFGELCESLKLGEPNKIDIDPMQGSTKRLTSAVIGFAGAEVQGSLVLSGSEDVFRQSHPAFDPNNKLSESKQHDWIGELSNQLLGRFKNKVIASDVTFSISTPLVMSAKEVVFGLVKGAKSETFYYELGNGKFIIIRFQVRHPAEFEFTDSSDGAPLVEGSTIIM